MSARPKAPAAPWQVRTQPDGSRWVQLAGRWVRVYARREFLEQVWDYQPGEHVGIFGPTQSAGKTRLIFELLGATDTSWCAIPPVVFIAKPHSPTAAAGLAKLGYQETPVWPPKGRKLERILGRERPPGYGFWPKHMADAPSPRANDEQLSAQFQRADHELFWTGNTIEVLDELYHFFALYDMADEVNRRLTQGGEMGSGLWFATQRPSGTQQAALSGFVFNSATHTFVSTDPTTTNRRRYGEIAAAPSEVIEDAAERMPRYYWLYIHRDGPKMCVIEKG